MFTHFNPTQPHPCLADISGDDDFIELWLNDKPSWESKRAYRKDISYLQAFVEGKEFKKLTLNDLQAYGQALSLQGYALSTVSRRLAAVKSLLTFGHKIGYLQFNVGSIIKIPTLKNTLAERILSEQQVQTIIALEPNPRNKLLLQFLYTSAGRVTEVCCLKWRDLKPVGDRGQVTFYGKGQKTRAIALPASLWKELQRVRGLDDDPVFASKKKSTGGALKANQVRIIVANAGKRAGIKGVSPHYFRHSHASHSLDRGASLQLVKDTLGHSSILVSERYLHAKPDDSSAMYLPS